MKGKWDAWGGSKITNEGILWVCKNRQKQWFTSLKGIKQSII